MIAKGIGIGRGAAIAPAVWMAPVPPDPPDTPSSRTSEEERGRAERALAETAADLRERASRSDPVTADVLLAQALMAEDPMVADGVETAVQDGKTAERAVFEAFGEIESVLRALGGTQGARAVDFEDVSRRTVAVLSGTPVPGVPERDEPFVLFARDLAPADTAELDMTRVRALVTVEGSPTSHTAILARAKGLPGVVACADCIGIEEGESVLIDAAAGEVSVIERDVTRADAEAMVARRMERRALSSGPGALADGTRVPLLANVGSLEDARQAKALGAEGIGLLRTEFLYIGASMAPTVEEQTAEYRAIFEEFAECSVTARTLDSGADKPLSFLNLDTEENPALGVRGMRIGASHRELLEDQLDALVAAAEGSGAAVRVMAPMVADAAEASWFAELARSRGADCVGVMVEVPSCALMAREVLSAVDFVSIGTNDLTQYTLAADRQHGGVAHYQDPWHPSLLRLIEMVGNAGRELGKPVGVCGEAAADPLLAVVLVGLGATTLSMTPAALADVRELLRWFEPEDARELAETAVACVAPAEARTAVEERVARLRASRAPV